MASPGVLARASEGLTLALVIALAAYRARSLSFSGAVAATVVGTVAMAAGWGWGILLVSYFVVSSLLSRVGSAERDRRVGGLVAKGGARDAWQVLANGGVFAVALAAANAVAQSTSVYLLAAAVGALAAAAADTWATEIGTLWGGVPRSVLGFRSVPVGTSGAVSVAGCVAMVAGAVFIALVARIAGIGVGLVPVFIGGVAGAIADSVAGATIQERRWCASCERATERAVHDCGATTALVGGMALVDNDVVNLLATLVGGAVASATLAFQGTEWH